MEEGDPSAAIEEEPGSDVPQEAPEPPANVVDLETVPPVEPEAQAEEVRAEEKESTPSRKAGGLPEIVSDSDGQFQLSVRALCRLSPTLCLVRASTLTRAYIIS